MKIEEKALNFAIKAHKGQIRKAEPDKPKIFHPIDVGNILKKYGYDENVVAAGYLHDVVEDTSYSFDDIKKRFGKDIASLVYVASEPDKSLSWEERKKHTIDTIKYLDSRLKAVICADKISNLEDLLYIINKTGKYDFSAFKKGFYDQQWYYTSVLESLKTNDTNEQLNPMLDRYNELLQKVFYNGDIDVYTRNVLLNNDEDRYKELKRLKYKLEELRKLRSISKLTNKPYVIEFTGTPRTGKTTIINQLEDLFKKGGFKTSVLEEFTTSKKYKQEIYPHLKDQYKNVINTEIPKYVLKELKKEIESNPDIIIVDRSLFDRLIWADRLFMKNGFTKEEYLNYKKEYIPIIRKYIDTIIGTYTDSVTSLQRDYRANLSLEKRNFLNKENIDEYNNSFDRAIKIAKKNRIDIHKIDTTDRTKEEVSIDTANIVLDDIRKEYINRLTKEYKL